MHNLHSKFNHLVPYRLSIIRLLFFFAVLLLSNLFFTCNLNADNLGLKNRDIQPPVLLGEEIFEDYFVLRFNETLARAEFSQLLPYIAVRSLQISGNKLTIQLEEKTIPGKSYLLRVRVSDDNGNVLNFLLRLYGKNLYPAQLLINELNPEGGKRSNSPELIEFFVLRAGNVGGLFFTIGTMEENKGSFIFPPLQVAKGDFILLHTRWDPTHKYDVTRINETVNQAQAQARLSSDQAWDFWADEIYAGLSDANTALALYQYPAADSPVMDAVIYSTSFTEERYRGWKSSFLQRQVDHLSELGAWRGTGNVLFPEDAIRSADSTGTRSLSRRQQAGQPIDTNTAADWIIVPTHSYTFGSPNTNEEYSK